MNPQELVSRSFSALGKSYDKTSPLFIVGCERSGTTALLALMNYDPHIILGRERFKFICNKLQPYHFKPDIFYNPRSEETNVLNYDYYEKLKDRWSKGGVLYIGDKNPLYFRHLDHLKETFSDAKFLFIVRDLDKVAASYNSRARNPDDRNWPENKDYQKAVVFWHESLRNIRHMFFNGGHDRIFFIKYEQFFSGHMKYFESLYAFLNLPLDGHMRSVYKKMTENWADRTKRPLGLTREEIQYLCDKKDQKLERWVLNHCEGGNTKHT